MDQQMMILEGTFALHDGGSCSAIDLRSRIYGLPRGGTSD
jgi:hypothetical protein